MGTSSDGVVLLSRHGTTYSAATGEVYAYPDLLERMLGLVLENFPSRLRERARVNLTSRWNRDWGVEAEDLAQLGAASANDNGSGFAAEAVATSTSPSQRSAGGMAGAGRLARYASVMVPRWALTDASAR